MSAPREIRDACVLLELTLAPDPVTWATALVPVRPSDLRLRHDWQRVLASLTEGSEER